MCWASATIPPGELVSASCRSGGDAETQTQTARGGPLDGDKVDPSKLTQTTAPNFNSLVLYYGGYYIQGPNGLEWHSIAVEAGIKMGILTASILGGEAIGPLAAGIRAIGSRAAATGGDRIVLGLANFGLEGTAAQVGGRTLLRDPAWRETFLAGLSNPSTRFTLSLEGLSGGSTYGQIMYSTGRFAAGRGGATDWEIGMLYQSGRLRGTGLYRDGGYVPDPF